MCRLLLVKSHMSFPIDDHLQQFAEICETSKEYQGHGWGISYWENNRQKVYKSIKPIWEDNFDKLGQTHFMLVHARSAFRDEGIVVENNMPFYDDRHTFIFNGELQGVSIKEQGRIGAEKIFNYIKRFDKGDMQTAFKKAIGIIEKKTKYVRAMNIIMSDFNKIYLSSLYNEDPGYFAMHQKEENGTFTICSQPYRGEKNWTQIENNTIRIF